MIDEGRTIVLSEKVFREIESKMVRDAEWIREAVRLMDLAAGKFCYDADDEFINQLWDHCKKVKK